MKKKVLNWKKLMLASCIILAIATMVAIYLTFVESFYFIFAICIGVGATLYTIGDFIGGYPAKETSDMGNGGKIKVLSLFKVIAEDGDYKHIYEIQYEDGRLDLLIEEVELEIGIKYEMKRINSEEWLKVS